MKKSMIAMLGVMFFAVTAQAEELAKNSELPPEKPVTTESEICNGNINSDRRGLLKAIHQHGEQIDLTSDLAREAKTKKSLYEISKSKFEKSDDRDQSTVRLALLALMTDSATIFSSDSENTAFSPGGFQMRSIMRNPLSINPGLTSSCIHLSVRSRFGYAKKGPTDFADVAADEGVKASGKAYLVAKIKSSDQILKLSATLGAAYLNYQATKHQNSQYSSASALYGGSYGSVFDKNVESNKSK